MKEQEKQNKERELGSPKEGGIVEAWGEGRGES